MSRVSCRAGSKALVCEECQRMYGPKSGKRVLSFRGKTQARLIKHLWEVHSVNYV